ncbi:MAG: hypothetical protein HC915_15305 [Anaerolineae bacterium]|nr:hypothetical protein [Anaerolineae bacterium]
MLAAEPTDVVARVSLAELLLEGDASAETAQRVVALAAGTENETYLHGALLLYQARALQVLGLTTAAREILTTALRRTKDRPAELLLALRYERALVYEALGEKSRAKADLEKVFIQHQAYADVRARLGL